MTLTIADAEDAWLDGSTEFEAWLEEIEAEWYAPLQRTLVATLFSSLPDEVLEQLAGMNPDAIQTLLAQYGGDQWQSDMMAAPAEVPNPNPIPGPIGYKGSPGGGGEIPTNQRNPTLPPAGSSGSSG